jgi:regulatory protein
MAFQRKGSGSKGLGPSSTSGERRYKEQSFKERAPREQTQKEYTTDEWREKARTLILNKLTRGPRSRFQLAQAMEKREIPVEIGEELLDRFTEVGLIDDAAFAKAFAHDRRANRGLSKAALRRELSNVGVEQQLIQDALEEIDSDQELELAIRLVSKRWNSVKNLDWQARQRRLSGFLGRRGFSGSVVSVAIKTVENQEQA